MLVRRVFLLATIAAMVLPAIAQKDTGVLEGTVVDQDRRPLRGFAVDINRTGYEDYSPKRRFLWRTDKQGHFHVGLPVGVYSVNIASPDGRILKEISDVRVEAGKVQNLDSALGLLPLASTPPEKKKTKQAITPTQADVIRGCIALRSITFERARLILLNSNLGVSGWIENKCGRDAYVSAEVKFFGANGDVVDEELMEKLVGPGGLEFRVGPSRTALEVKPDAVYSTVGRVTDVWVRFQP